MNLYQQMIRETMAARRTHRCRRPAPRRRVDAPGARVPRRPVPVAVHPGSEDRLGVHRGWARADSEALAESYGL